MIFDSIGCDSGIKTLDYALQCILTRKQNLKLSSPWSYVELQPDKADSIWLQNWANNLRASTISEAKKRDKERHDTGISFDGTLYRWQDSLGVLILFVGADSGRKSAHAKEIWPLLRKCFPDRSVTKLLFQNDNASQELRELIKSAATNPDLELRHDFETHEGQSWYNTFWLQFGFSYPAFYGDAEDGSETELPAWLSRQKGGASLISVDFLLNHEKMHSRSFYQLWRSMAEFRRKERDEASLCTILQHNAWILPEWSTDLVRCLKKRSELMPDLPRLQFDDPSEEYVPFQAPRLEWKDNAPIFQFLVSDCYLPCESDELTLTFRSDDCLLDCSAVKLIQQPNGNYSSIRSTPILIPAYCQSVTAELCDVNNVPVWSQQYLLWDAGEDVTIFSLTTGKKLRDPENDEMRTDQGYILFVADDLICSDNTLHVKSLPSVDTKAYLLPRNWNEALKIQIGDVDSCLWQPNLATRARRTPPVKVHPKDRIQHFDANIPLIAECSNGRALEAALCNGKPLKRVFSSEGCYLLDNAILSSQNPRRRLFLKLRLHCNDIIETHDVVVRLNPEGMLMRKKDQIWPCNPNDELDIHVAQHNDFRVFTPERDGERSTGNWMLWEGDTPHGKVVERWRELPRFDGLGAEFTARTGEESEEYFSLSSSVVDHGVMDRYKITTDDAGKRWITIYLHPQKLDPQGLEIRWWDTQWHMQCWEPDNRPKGYQWDIPLQSACHGTPFALAIAQKGLRLGALWDKKWYQSKCLMNLGNMDATARNIRWLHLPILQASARTNIQQFVARAGDNLYSLWLEDVDTLEWKYDRRLSDAWRRAVIGLLK